MAAAHPPVNRSRAYCTWNLGDDTTVPLTEQSGVSSALVNVSDEFGSFHAVTTLLGPQPPSRKTLTAALLIDSWVVLSAWPVHGFELLAVPVMRPHVPPPVNDVDVILTMPDGVIVVRQLGQAAFELALADRHASPAGSHARPILIAADCPRLWLVILHLRLTGKPFVLRGH